MALVTTAPFISSILGRSLGRMKSMMRVEEAVMVMEARVDTDAAISSTSTSPTSTVGRPASASILGTR